MAGFNHVSKLEKMQRIDLLLELVSFGYTEDQIFERICETWGIDRPQFRNYMVDVRAILAAVAQENVAEEVLPRLMMLHRRMQQKGYEDKDYRLALQAAKEEAELLGLHQPKPQATTPPTAILIQGNTTRE